jgi:hypothetical protein
MRSWHPWLLIVTIAACSGKDDKTDTDVTDSPDADADADADSDTDTDTDADADCAATITTIDPAPDTFLVPLDTQVTAFFSEAIAATDPFDIAVSGAPGTVTLAADGLSASWTGTLEYETDYEVSAEVCGSSDTSNFRTLPEPIDPSLVEGNTYLLPWGELEITEPGNDQALNIFITVDYILAQVLTVDGTEADTYSTVAYVDEETGEILPECEVAAQQPADFSLNPYFQIIGDLALVIDPTTDPPQVADIEDFTLQARVSPDGLSLTDVTLSGLVATEQILEGEDCNSQTVQLLNPTCVPCTISDTLECLLFEANAAQALVDDTIDLYGYCNPPI